MTLFLSNEKEVLLRVKIKGMKFIDRVKMAWIVLIDGYVTQTHVRELDIGWTNAFLKGFHLAEKKNRRSK